MKGLLLSFGPNPWFGPWMNRQHLLSRLAGRGWGVVYTTGALSLWDRGHEEWKDAPLRTTWEASDGVRVIRPGRLAAYWPRAGQWARWARRRHLAAMRAAADRGFGRGCCCIAYLFHPKFYPYVAEAWEGPVVYHVYDALSLAPGWTLEMASLEAALAKRADLVVAVTEQMADLLPADARAKTRVLPNGADVGAFERGPERPCPPDLAAVPRPRIGYVGNVSPKVDLPLVAHLAQRHPEWHWVFVGRLVPGPSGMRPGSPFREEWERCERLPNVHYLGEKPHGDLPAYVGHMDVNTMCYRSEGKGWWGAGYPLKMHEYLAVGKPVVSADIESVRPFESVVALARGVDEWSRCIGEALAGRGRGTPDERRRVAAENSWDKRVEKLEAMLSPLLA